MSNNIKESIDKLIETREEFSYSFAQGLIKPQGFSVEVNGRTAKDAAGIAQAIEILSTESMMVMDNHYYHFRYSPFIEGYVVHAMLNYSAFEDAARTAKKLNKDFVWDEANEWDTPYNEETFGYEY